MAKNLKINMPLKKIQNYKGIKRSKFFEKNIDYADKIYVAETEKNVAKIGIMLKIDKNVEKREKCWNLFNKKLKKVVKI
jgi:hypothetical protein